MKAFEYCRKSTKDKEDQQILSLPGQREENARAIERGGHTVLYTFEEEMSAKQPGRVFFGEMLDRIEAGEAEAIVCWKLNRLARNPIDGGRIQWMLQRGIIKAIITPEKTYLPTDNVIQMSVEFGMATQFSIDLGKDVKRGMMQKVKMGWKPGIAPVGYASDYGGLKGEKKITKDLERFPLMRKCWELLLAGDQTVEEIHDIAVKDWGLTVFRGRKKLARPLGISTLFDAFNNPFYCGQFKWDGTLWTGAHEPMVTREEFDRAQAILGSRGRPLTQERENPFAWTIRCGECKACIVMELKKKILRTTSIEKSYTYFRCSKSKKCSQVGGVSGLVMEGYLKSLIEKVEMPQAFIDWGLKQLKISQEDQRHERARELAQLQEKHRMSEKKIDDLIDMRLSEPQLFTETSFKRKMVQLEKDRTRAENAIKEHGKYAKTVRDELIDDLMFIERIRQKFETGSSGEKREILNRLTTLLELRDKELNYRLDETFQSLSIGKKTMIDAIGSLEPLERRLETVQSDILSKVIPIWSR